jgi:CubicO group peptidase (beta-lactamase class C family)
MRPHTTALLLALLAAPGAAAGQARDVTSVLAPIRARHDVPAIAGAIVAGGELAAIGADGVRERGKPEKATTSDLWHLGSCTKAMTATLCAQLVEEKKLSWTTTVGEVFGDVKGMDAAWKPVTLEQLLTNHGGAPANLDAGGLWGRLWAHEGTPQEQRRALVEGVLARPPESKPGTKYLYSNAGFSIAGAMAETVAKEPYESLIAKRLFEPLGMTSAGFGPPGKADVLDQPRGHGADGKPVAPGKAADNPAAIAPAGRVHCTIGDWAKFVALHVRGETKGSTKLLTRESFVKLHAPVADESRYAMGWIVTDRPWAGGRALTHSGSNTMWYCTTWFAPDRDFAVLVATNQGGDEAAKACDEACAALIQDHLAQTKAKRSR